MKSLATAAIWYTSDSYTAASKFSLMKGHKGGCQPATPFETGLSGKLKRADLKDSRKFLLRATKVSLFPLILSCNHPFRKFHMFQQTTHATPNIASSNNSFNLRSLVEKFGVETPGFNVKGAAIWKKRRDNRKIYEIRFRLWWNKNLNTDSSPRVCA